MHSHKESFYLVPGYWGESHEGLCNGANRVFVIRILQSLIYDLLIEIPNSLLRKMK